MKKKKILLLSDDLRLTSGIATISRDMVMGTVKNYDWVQLGAALGHPERGRVFDISDSVKNVTGVQDVNVKIYCSDGYGNPLVLRQLMEIEKPDAILHFTDPRFWDWLYSMEHEIRTKIPLIYLNIWDSMPWPMWNFEAYASCDLLMAISKQTYGINVNVLSKFRHATVSCVDWNGNTIDASYLNNSDYIS
ncbi:putative glycosyltransferases [Microcystis phage Mel-JY01]